MNNVKELIKHFFGKIRSLKFGISAEKNVYIGKHCDFKGKKNIQLKNISIKDLKIVDTDTGEDITEQVIDEIPDGVDVCDFKLTFELPDEV